MKRLFFAVLCGILAASVFASGKQAGGKTPVRYYMPGAPTGPQAEADAVTAAINAAMEKDGLNLEYQPMYIPWDQWVNKINMMISSGEEFELLHVMEDYIPTATYVSRGALTPLDELIKKNAPQLLTYFGPVLWGSATVNGKIYAVPAEWRDASGDFEGNMNIRKDKFDQYGIPVPKTTAEMITALETLQSKWSAEDGKKRYVFEHSLDRAPIALHRTYNTWPYYVSMNGIFQVKQNGSAALYFTTEEFKKDAEFMNTLYTKGLIHPDVLNLPADTRRELLDYGDYLLGIQTGPNNTYELTSKGVGGVVLQYKLSPEKPILTVLPLMNTNAVPVTTKHPEAGIRFLNWVYANQENQDLLLHGIKGRHWNPVGTDQYSVVKGSDGLPLYSFDYWMIEYIKYHRFDVEDKSTQEEKDNWLRNIYPDNTEVSPMVGFNFNSEPVQVEMTNVLAEYTASMVPIKVGVVPYASGYAAALAKMKAAGCDAVIAEYQKQLAAYIAGKK
ncbi:MAG: extracellular solute-binding protein [Treponema sp.]|nr:extracellular solute-binding protein [Treponema sp.]